MRGTQSLVSRPESRVTHSERTFNYECPLCRRKFLRPLDNGLCMECVNLQRRTKQAIREVIGDDRPRYWPCSFDTYTTENPAQETVLKACQSFAGQTRGHALVMLGTEGTGKTHLACSIIREWLWRQRGSAMYRRLNEMFLELKSTFKKGGATERALLSRYGLASLLVIDEFDKTAQTEWEVETIIPDLIERRYAALTYTVLVANMDENAFKSMLPPSTIGRIRGMMCGHRPLIFNWPSYRAGIAKLNEDPDKPITASSVIKLEIVE